MYARDVECSLKGSTGVVLSTPVLPGISVNDILWWLQCECAAIYPFTTVEGAQTPYVCMIWMWGAKVLRPQL